MSKIREYLSTNPELTRAVVCFLVKDSQVLLGVRKKVSNDLGLNLVAGIGGKHEGGETSKQAAIRELAEEIEVEVSEENLEEAGNVKFLFPHKPNWNQDVDVFVVREWSGEPKETEPIKPEWFDIDNLPGSDRTWPDFQFWVPDVLQGKPIKSVFLYGVDGMVAEFKK